MSASESLGRSDDGHLMAAPFSIEHIARVRDGSRRLATKAAHHELAIRKFLTDAESAFAEAEVDDAAAGDESSDEWAGDGAQA